MARACWSHPVSAELAIKRFALVQGTNLHQRKGFASIDASFSVDGAKIFQHFVDKFSQDMVYIKIFTYIKADARGNCNQGCVIFKYIIEEKVCIRL